MKYVKVNIEEQTERESLSFQAEQNKAYIDYVAIMSGIELPEEKKDDRRGED